MKSGRSHSESKVSTPRGSPGFALPAVLMVSAIVAVIAVALIQKSSARTVATQAIERRIAEGLLLDAALARGTLALLVSDDPLVELLRRDGRAAWSFAGRALVVELSMESDKLDANAASADVLAPVLAQMLGPELGAVALSRLAAQRSLRRPFDSLDGLLPVTDRFSSANARLRDQLTVFGGGMEPASPWTTDASRAHGRPIERPIYTLRSRFEGGHRARAVTLMIDPEARKYTVLDRADLTLDPSNSDQ